MAILDQLNIVNCGVGNYLGTGGEACTFQFDHAVAIGIASTTYVQATDISLANIRIAQQKEELFIIGDIEKFTQVAVAPIESTTEGTGFKSVDAEYPYEFNFEFKNKGFNFWKAVRKFNSTKRNSIVFFDKNGNTLMTLSADGSVRYFKAAQIYTGQYMFRQGTAAEMFTMKLQLKSIVEMENAHWVTSEISGLDSGLLDGWNDVLFTASPVANAATTVVVKATLSDNSHFVSGLTATDFLVKKNGVAVTVSAVVEDESAKTYTLTIPAAATGETYTITTKNTYNKGVVLQSVSGLLFKGNVATVIVA